ncbi:MAG: tRNA threonylcarbamoyladenosine dehydratase [Acetobacter sp.]|nr:tRNA threonylcarbamoyladenosine dehydratase [Bacteroides sp.]MCM1340882.1 tRNA threonylcarbamoyladenosine dehydratase [Acetobacter sp.]MCM1432561.1 tRNA threonylcarbamoyladenosine dehydratase [Clostridiales bacterium]
MTDQFTRIRMMLGADAINRLQSSSVAVFGVGGVGGYAVEALARSGIGSIDVIDNDTISLTNINRQIIALHSTIGRFKVDVAKERILDINPNIKVNAINAFYAPDNSLEFDLSKYDYIVDAIDTVSGKIELAVQADRAGVPIISSMGAGNKLDASAFEVSDIYKTSVCPLAKVMRRELKKRSIKGLKVVYSKEESHKIIEESDEKQQGRRQIPASNAFVPSVAGLIIAGEVIKDLSNNKS